MEGLSKYQFISISRNFKHVKSTKLKLLPVHLYKLRQPFLCYVKLNKRQLSSPFTLADKHVPFIFFGNEKFKF